MKFQVIHQPNSGGARSPFHIVETQTGRDVEWINRFLDRECVRCLAETTLRSYAMDLLHFLRWWDGVNHTDAVAESALASDGNGRSPATNATSRNGRSSAQLCRRHRETRCAKRNRQQSPGG